MQPKKSTRPKKKTPSKKKKKQMPPSPKPKVQKKMEKKKVAAKAKFKKVVKRTYVQKDKEPKSFKDYVKKDTAKRIRSVKKILLKIDAKTNGTPNVHDKPDSRRVPNKHEVDMRRLFKRRSLDPDKIKQGKSPLDYKPKKKTPSKKKKSVKGRK